MYLDCGRKWGDWILSSRVLTYRPLGVRNQYISIFSPKPGKMVRVTSETVSGKIKHKKINNTNFIPDLSVNGLTMTTTSPIDKHVPHGPLCCIPHCSEQLTLSALTWTFSTLFNWLLFIHICSCKKNM